MNFTRTLAAFTAAFSLAACSTAARQGSGSASRPYVVMVSFDAFRADYIDRYQPPALLGIANRGVRAVSIIPSFPSKTFPNHYALVTGDYPGNHGIVGNSFYDPARRQWYRSNSPATVTDSSWYSGEPIWATAERNGVKSAAYFWPGSEAAIGGIRPSYWTKYDGKVTNETRVNGVISWLRKPGAERPHLALVYFSDVDDTTHRNGPDAPSTANVVRNVDRVLAMLVDSIRTLPFRDSVNIVIVSDHGMTATSASRLIGVSEVLIAAGVDTTGIEMSDNGPTLSLWFGGDSVRARRALAALAPVAHMQSYARAGIPERFHVRQSPRIGDLLLIADEGWTIERRLSDRSPSTGAHGYDPALANMQGIFLAAGPNVRALGKIPSFENVNVYPFVAALLRLEHVPKVDGDISVLGGALR